MSRRSTLSLYSQTVARLQPAQLLGTLERKLHNAVVPRLPVDLDARYDRRVPAELTPSLDALAANTDAVRESLPSSVREEHRRLATDAVEGRVTFMNRTLEDPAWTDERLEDLPRLWRLKLYAFEPLWWAISGFEDPAEAPEVVEHLDERLADWRASIGIGDAGHLRGAWTPYAVSLRVLYGLRYLAWRGEDDGALARQVYRDVLFLRNHVETDVGGNHLVENGAALVVAGVCFEEASWITEGLSVLETVAGDQFLPGGSHYERSPMYHVLTVTRYLTVVDLLRRTGRSVPAAVAGVARDGVSFLRFIEPPDGEIPLLNDAVHGEGLPLAACLRYAAAVEGGEPATTGIGTETENDSEHERDGYHWLRNDAGAMLVDGGPLGPPSLPGHAHVDPLSVLLWVGGQPVVTDTGVFDYEDGPDRQYARGARGHNTVQVGEAEPVDIGGRFLMGRAPTPETHRDGDRLRGSYETRPTGGRAFSHDRTVESGTDWWLVWDRVTTRVPPAPVTSRLHLHPDVGVARTTDGFELTGPDGDGLAWVYPLSARSARDVSGPYFPRFGVRESRSVLELSAEAEPRAAFGYLVSARPGDGVSVGTDTEGRPHELRFGAETYPLGTD